MKEKTTKEGKGKEGREEVVGLYPEGKKKNKGQEPLPFCRKAPDPEHHRGKDNGEPCDDYRAGE